MSVFTIGDLHLSFGCNKPMDIFKGWNNYVEKLKENWQKTISDNDTVVIAGDFSWSMNLNEAKLDFEFLNSLKGEKIILKGNHDYWWDTKAKIDKFLFENGFNTIKILHNNSYFRDNINICGARGWVVEAGCEHDEKIISREVGRLHISLNSADKEHERVVFLHYPPIYASTECEEIINLLITQNIKRCYYGHIHGESSNGAIIGDYKGIDFRLISCDYTEFCPIKVQ